MPFTIEQLAFTLDFIGKILLGISVVRVHLKVRHDRKIDKAVLKSIKKEAWWTYIGIIFLIIGWLMHIL